ncbi:MAG: single-stranded DNA-binding protein [Bacilli bacterium]|nr:single-stranded DNA-binding protein [Firmicutes bacterium CAG:345]
MMNRAVLVGRIVRDPELRKTTSGMSVVSFTLAIDNRVRQGAERTTSFIPVTAWNQTADNIAKYVHKGMLLGVDGRLNQRSYTNNENRKVSVVEVIADTVTFLEKRQDSGNDQSSLGYEDNRSQNSYSSAEMNDNQESDITTDDDLPF